LSCKTTAAAAAAFFRKNKNFDRQAAELLCDAD